MQKLKESLKVRIALFFILLFSTIIITPTVISLVDDTLDISVFLTMNEEEENQGTKTVKEVKILPNSHSTIIFSKIQKRKNVRFRSKDYISEYPKIVTPPPKFVL